MHDRIANANLTIKKTEIKLLREIILTANLQNLSEQSANTVNFYYPFTSFSLFLIKKKQPTNNPQSTAIHLPPHQCHYYRKSLILQFWAFLDAILMNISFAVSPFLYNFADEPNKKLGVQHGLCC